MMNKYETAIAEIQDRSVHTLKTVLSAETAEVAVEAINNRIPQLARKTTIFEGKQAEKLKTNGIQNFETYKCPCCNHIVHNQSRLIARQIYNFCPNCGQALKWSGENE